VVLCHSIRVVTVTSHRDERETPQGPVHVLESRRYIFWDVLAVVFFRGAMATPLRIIHARHPSPVSRSGWMREVRQVLGYSSGVFFPVALSAPPPPPTPPVPHSGDACQACRRTQSVTAVTREALRQKAVLGLFEFDCCCWRVYCARLVAARAPDLSRYREQPSLAVACDTVRDPPTRGASSIALSMRGSLSSCRGRLRLS